MSSNLKHVVFFKREVFLSCLFSYSKMLQYLLMQICHIILLLFVCNICCVMQMSKVRYLSIVFHTSIIHLLKEYLVKVYKNNYSQVTS